MEHKQNDLGKTQWVYPDLELPPPGDFPIKGHESLTGVVQCVANK